MHFKAVIFDLDGTLLDTLQDIANAGNTVLANNGFPIHRTDDYRGFIGSGINKLISRALPRNNQNPETVVTLAEEFRVEYSHTWNVTTRVYPGVPEMLDGLQAQSIKLAVLSNKPHDFTQQCVDGLLNDWTFEAVMGYNDKIPPKPDPKGALQIAGKLNSPPSRILYLGDTDIDMKTAIAAGMFPLGALWGFRSKEELFENGAKALLQRPQDILSFFNPSSPSDKEVLPDKY